MRNTKKGFTLVELLIVIAIIAILATVSVVGYTAFIEKANQSVDDQFVAQINHALVTLDTEDEAVVDKLDPANQTVDSTLTGDEKTAAQIAAAKTAIIDYLKANAEVEAADLVCKQKDAALCYDVDNQIVVIKKTADLNANDMKIINLTPAT